MILVLKDWPWIYLLYVLLELLLKNFKLVMLINFSALWVLELWGAKMHIAQIAILTCVLGLNWRVFD